MKVTLIGYNSREGESKKTGNHYKMNFISCLLPIPASKIKVVSENNILTQEGYRVLNQDVSDNVYDEIMLGVASSPMPCEVELTVSNDVNQDGDLVQVVDEVMFY